MDQYSIEWADLKEHQALAERFWCEGHTGQLPFLVDANDKPADGSPIAFNEFMLVGGLLLTWLDSKEVQPAEKVRQAQLEKLHEGFGFIDTEGLITGYAHRMRLLYGNGVSCPILRNGRQLFPNSSPIAADLAMDLAYILSATETDDAQDLLNGLMDAINAVKRDETEDEIWQILLVLKLAGLKVNGDQQAAQTHLETAVKGNITSPDLQLAINRLSTMTSTNIREAFQPLEWSGLNVQTMEEHECDH
ncbi:MAG: hypothetical protein OEU86_00255 [Gammaproteobacteria bacterium]|nr:hypothetical protein [Gammaproteobacteria bacterium]